MFFKYRLSRELLVAVASGWDKHVVIIDKIIPQAWKVRYLFLSFYVDSSIPSTCITASNYLYVQQSGSNMYLFCILHHCFSHYTVLVNNHSDAYQKLFTVWFERILILYITPLFFVALN
jgi:hypothetical protein